MSHYQKNNDSLCHISLNAQLDVSRVQNQIISKL